MEEMLSSGDGLPSELAEALYEIWAEGGYGMLISGASSSCLSSSDRAAALKL